jgi:hypothetical protein
MDVVPRTWRGEGSLGLLTHYGSQKVARYLDISGLGVSLVAGVFEIVSSRRNRQNQRACSVSREVGGGTSLGGEL